MAVRDWNNDGKIDSYDDWAEWEGLYDSDTKGGLNNVHSDYCYLHEDSEDGYFSNQYTDSDSTSHSDYNSGTSTDSHDSSGISTFSHDNSETSTDSGNSFKDSDSHSSYHDSYDDGYDDIYENEDYDVERYKNDSEYQEGVDDAMDDMDEDY